MKLHWILWAMNHRFLVLLSTLGLLLFVSPVYHEVRLSSPTFFSRVVAAGCFNLMLISSLFVISRSRKVLVAAVALSIPALILRGINVVHQPDLIRMSGLFFSILFLGFTTVMILRGLFHKKDITADLICAALCAYLFLAIIWSCLFSLTEILIPGSFSISDAHYGVSGALDVTGGDAGFALYYSLVTLSTLGYGDVIPTHPVSRILSSGEAVIGQVYLAVLIARLVGLQISQSLMQKKKAVDP